jgi:DNA-binding transcriptional LysR family regulator
MSMNAELIRIFRVVVQEGSMTKAAPLLNMTQSLVSKSMTKLEHQSKTQLLIRTKHGITVTDMGERLMDFSNKLHDSIEVFEKDFMEDRTKVEGIIKIVAFPYLGAEWLIKTITEFFEAHPKVRFSITLKEDNVLPSNYDVGIGGFIPNQPYLFQRELFPDYNRIYASKEYLKKYGTPLVIEDLDNHRLITYGGNNSYSGVRSTNLLMNLGLSANSLPREPLVDINSLLV